MRHALMLSVVLAVLLSGAAIADNDKQPALSDVEQVLWKTLSTGPSEGGWAPTTLADLAKVSLPRAEECYARMYADAAKRTTLVRAGWPSAAPLIVTKEEAEGKGREPGPTTTAPPPPS